MGLVQRDNLNQSNSTSLSRSLTLFPLVIMGLAYMIPTAAFTIWCGISYNGRESSSGICCSINYDSVYSL